MATNHDGRGGCGFRGHDWAVVEFIPGSCSLYDHENVIRDDELSIGYRE